MQKRDWGHAKDYVQMQWLMLQQKTPEDYVIASGQMKSVREFIELSAIELGWNKEKGGKGIIWEGSGVNEIGRRKDTNEIVIKVDKRYFRPAEVDQLVGDATKANLKLGWTPEITLEELIEEMISEDNENALKELNLLTEGFKVSKKVI